MIKKLPFAIKILFIVQAVFIFLLEQVTGNANESWFIPNEKAWILVIIGIVTGIVAICFLIDAQERSSNEWARMIILILFTILVDFTIIYFGRHTEVGNILLIVSFGFSFIIISFPVFPF